MQDLAADADQRRIGTDRTAATRKRLAHVIGHRVHRHRAWPSWPITSWGSGMGYVVMIHQPLYLGGLLCSCQVIRRTAEIEARLRNRGQVRGSPEHG